MAEPTVADIMQTELVQCAPDTAIPAAAKHMSETGCGSILVMGNDGPAGIWTERDVLKVDFTDPTWQNRPIQAVMSSPLKTIGQNATLGEAAHRLREEGIRHLLVTDEAGQPLGLLSQSDVVLNQGVEWYLRLREVATALHGPPLILASTTDLGEASAAMQAHHGQAAIVDYPEGNPGILTERDILRGLARNATEQCIGDLASRPLATVEADVSLLHARNLMVENHYRHMGVVDSTGALTGLISFSDILSNVEHMYVDQLQEALQERDSALAASRQNLYLAEKVIESSLEGIMITDPQGRIQSVNPAFSRVTGYTEAEVTGETPALLSSGYHDADFYAAMWRTLAETGAWQGEIWNRRKNGEIYPELLTITAITDDSGTVRHYAGIFSDITQLKAQQDQIRSQGYYDPLTELPNRRLLYDRLGMALEVARRHGTKVGVLFLDLDEFKEVNDTLGHSAGDDLLIELADRLDACVRGQDTVARLGGDEFILVASEVTATEDLAHLAQRVLESFREPVQVAGRSLYLGGSLGISIFPDDGADAETLVRNADAAMYRTKDRGRGDFHFYSRALDDTSHEHLDWEARLHAAYHNGELTLVYQPIFPTNGTNPVAVEALLRWDHPDQGLLRPVVFLATVERSGLIEPIGEWVVATACQQLRQWRASGGGHFPVSVNLSSRQLRQKDLLAKLQQAVASQGLAPSDLHLEMPAETVGNDPDALSVAEDLHQAGFGVVLDDFGRGPSRLADLSRLPLTGVKVDQELVAALPEDGDTTTTIAGLVALAHALGWPVTAEGVENAAQLEQSRALGCDHLQGFWTGGPRLPYPETRFDEMAQAQS